MPPGVDEAAYVKAGFLTSIAKGDEICKAISQKHATFLLGTMLGGYSITSLIDLLDINETAESASDALSHNILIYEAHQMILEKSLKQIPLKTIIPNQESQEQQKKLVLLNQSKVIFIIRKNLNIKNY